MTKTKVHSKALDATINVDRLIGHIKGDEEGPTLIFMGGIHGNEPAGVFALNKVFEQLNAKAIKGNIYGIAGNLWALNHGERFEKEDLNRLWTLQRMKRLSSNGHRPIHQDEKEQIEINLLIDKILKEEKGPFYFFDMHTTSSETLPFLTVNDSLLNRAFTFQYPLPIILGIEEYLDGPILSYINELGYVAFGFEAGQHDEMASIQHCIAFIYLSLVFTRTLDPSQIDYHKYHDSLAKTSGDIRHIYEIHFRYLIKENENFKMLPGFYNFQRIKARQHIANSDGRRILAKNNGRIFMPLYQPKGSDGFFAIKKIWKPFLRLSAFIRKYRLDRLLVFLPGVKWLNKDKSYLIVNKKIALFLAKDIFHLFGFRSIHLDENNYLMHNREATAKFEEYENEPWMTN